MTSSLEQLIQETKGKPTAFIPARKGSKRLKGKNKALLNGKPLVEYTIEAAITSEVFGMIIVSSDDLEILDIAIKHFNHGLVQPHKRPKGLAGDKIELRDLCRFLIQAYEIGEIFCLLQPTNPFRTAQDIRNAYGLFWDKKSNYVASVVEAPSSTQVFLEVKRGYLKRCSRVCYPDGSIIFARTGVFLREFGLAFFGGTKVIPYFMARSVDIHTAEDLAYAEVLMKNER